MIEHKIYFNGAVQSLRSKGKDGKEFSVGIIEPGEHDFGKATRRETISWQSGYFEVNGRIMCNLGHTVVVEPGHFVLIHAEEVSTYRCVYD